MIFTCLAGFRGKGMLPIGIIITGMVILSACTPTTISYSVQGSGRCQPDHRVGFLRTSHGELVDASGCQVVLTGVNWFGFETSTFVPHGLGVRNLQDMLNQMTQTGFNTIRLPFTNQLFDPASKPRGINYRLNPDLKGLMGLALMDRIIQDAGKIGLKVILDRHDPTADLRPQLWYTDQVPQAGNAILAVNPDWLIIVEGIEQYHGDFYWWGGNLKGAKQFPVQLSRPEKLVYSAHDYGPEVYLQQWLQVPKPADLAHTLPGVWQQHWAYLQKMGIAPVFMGEFGGSSMGNDAEGVWQRTLIAFLKLNNMSYTYWAWNPDSSDTGGILQANWRTVNQSKLNILSAYQWPKLGQPPSHKSKHSENSGAILNAYQWPPSK